MKDGLTGCYHSCFSSHLPYQSRTDNTVTTHSSDGITNLPRIVPLHCCATSHHNRFILGARLVRARCTDRNTCGCSSCNFLVSLIYWPREHTNRRGRHFERSHRKCIEPSDMDFVQLISLYSPARVFFHPCFLCCNVLHISGRRLHDHFRIWPIESSARSAQCTFICLDDHLAWRVSLFFGCL